MANATTRTKRLNETKMILRQPLLLIAILLSFALLLLFVIYPLAKTLIYSLTDETARSLWPISSPSCKRPGTARYSAAPWRWA